MGVCYGCLCGTGRATALALVARGVNLPVNARTENQFPELKQELSGEHGILVEELVFDIRDLKR